MSRIGRQPIAIPAGVEVSVSGRTVTVKGPKSSSPLVKEVHSNLTVEHDQEKKEVRISRPDDERLNRSLHGLWRSLIANMIEGVTKGYEKTLKIEGLGYQAELNGTTVVLSVGFANKIKLTAPEGVEVKLNDPTVIVVSGVDKQKVGQFAAEIRRARPPEPYKGKGVRYMDETPRRKEGKSFTGGG